MGTRRIGRERALQALYQLDMGSAVNPTAALDSAWSASDEPRTPDAQAFALDLVLGVHGHLSEIDSLIEKHSHNWRVDRMSRIDRNVLRLGIYELRHRDDIPRKVTLNEAVELGKVFGSQESFSFINGLLDRVASALGKA